MAGLKGDKAAAILLLAFIGIFVFSVSSALANECVNCHTDADKLRSITEGFNKTFAQSPPAMPTRGGNIAPVERYKKVLISEEFFEDENHGELSCQECHGGNPETTDFKKAHKGVDYEPSYPASNACLDCHEEAENFASSLHYNVRGMKAALEVRANPDPAAQKTIENSFSYCNRCHSSCGQCHVNRPVHVGGGLKDGHKFTKTPSMEETCAACHASAFREFSGENKNVEPDIHAENDMTCLDCHSGDEMHGDGKEYANRYEVANGPACMDCHEEIYEEDAENKSTHNFHKDKVSCHVCHSQAYSNCGQCHLDKDWDDMEKFTHTVDFKIGLNPNKTERHPENFVTVRNVPVHKDMFAHLGPDVLSNFSKAPTWKMATPHTIRRKTTQNAECNNCHGFKNKKLYLGRADVERLDRKANRSVIVPPASIPAPITE